MFEIQLGPETDGALFDRVRKAVVTLGGKIKESSYGVVGLQEVITYAISLSSGAVELESETLWI
jgi:hypothetical protein